jgi:hypothetical protein
MVQRSLLLSAMILALALTLFGPETAIALPDNRAYELVSPPDTNAIIPSAAAIGKSDGFDCFETSTATPDGEGVAFASDIGALKGLASNGVLNLYESSRTSTGWATVSKSATGQQSNFPSGGVCLSEDHEFSTLLTGNEPLDSGSLVLNGEQTSYIRTPEGDYAMPGIGSIGTDQKANVKWISEGASHIILTAQKRLESNAPVGVGPGHGYESAENPVNAVYDRTPAGLRVVSLLPSGLAPNSTSETTFYRGASRDGSSVVFSVEKSNGSMSLYEHRDNGPTAALATGANAGVYWFGGISSDGRRVVYLKKGPDSPPNIHRGSIYLFDADTSTSVPVSTETEAAIVNVSADGSHIYFTSQEALPGSGQNPLGAGAQAGAANLYVWDAATESVKFIATVAPVDVEEDLSRGENLTEWIRTVVRPQQDSNAGRMNAASRTTPDGSVFVFQAHGNVTGYDSGGYSEIYRYTADGSELSCISCPNGSAASDSFLERSFISPIVGLDALIAIPNVTEDGSTVFYMTEDPLVAGDTNEQVDVYEWREGTISLISSGTSPLPSMLYGMSSSGRDVFFLTTDQLVPQDISSVLSIYDARVEGGFPAAVPVTPCDEGDCKGPAMQPPLAPSIGSGASLPGNVHELRHPKPRCKKKPRHCRKHHRKRHHRRDGSHR